jgi:hypothetical protein
MLYNLTIKRNLYADLTQDIELKLDEADNQAEKTDTHYGHKNVFKRLENRV